MMQSIACIIPPRPEVLQFAKLQLAGEAEGLDDLGALAPEWLLKHFWRGLRETWNEYER
jgi:hypothetical protein